MMFGQTNVSKPKTFYIAKEVKPPVLNIEQNSIRFFDLNANNAIDANEQSFIKFQVTNSGDGDGIGCYVRVSASGTTDGISVSDLKLNTIPAGEVREIELPISSNIETKNGQINLSITISEAQGFGTDPTLLSVNTRQFESPLLKVVDYSITGGSASAKLEKRVPFDLQVLLQNTNYGKAEDVNIKIKIPNGITLLDEGMSNTTFDEIKGGDTKSLVFPLIALVSYNQNEIPIDIEISEKYGKYAENRTISLTLNQNLSNTKIAIQAIEEERKDIVISHLSSSVDREIPKSKVTNDKTFAVIIANENYQNTSNVPFAINDGRVFMQYCENTLGIPTRNIHYVPNATLNNMRGEIHWLENVLRSYEGEAKAIFYYAGHGVPDEASKDSYLLPVDGLGTNVKTGYKLDDLYASLGTLPSKSITVFLDACFSGATRSEEMLTPSLRGVVIKSNTSTPKGNVVVFSAAQGNETAIPYNDESHGMFTYYLLKKLQETSGKVSYQELSEYIYRNVRQQSSVIGKTQTPTVIPSSIVGDNWKDWSF